MQSQPHLANHASTGRIERVGQEPITPPAPIVAAIHAGKFTADAVLEINPEVVCEGRSLPRPAAPKGQPPIAGGDQRERACETHGISQEKPDEAHRAKSGNPRKHGDMNSSPVRATVSEGRGRSPLRGLEWLARFPGVPSPDFVGFSHPGLLAHGPLRAKKNKLTPSTHAFSAALHFTADRQFGARNFPNMKSLS